MAWEENPRICLHMQLIAILSRTGVEMYNSLLRSDSQMQLICTTHESNLLSTAPIRQDEVWFVEKDKKGESHLSSLCEYKPRENVQKGYLNGRYGAIPFFGELNNIHWDNAKQE